MRWLLEFYNERRGLLKRYSIDAPLPAAAVTLGRQAVLAEDPATPRTRRRTLLDLADRSGGHDASGWVLYRIVEDKRAEPAGATSAPTA
jgi:hypothetical protein